MWCKCIWKAYVNDLKFQETQYSDIDYMNRQLDFTIDPINYVGLTEYVQKLKSVHNMRWADIICKLLKLKKKDKTL